MSIDSRLQRLESDLPTEGCPTMVVYEADEELSAEDEAAFINASVPDISPNALIVGIRRLVVTTPAPPRIVQTESTGLTHEEALAHLK